MRFRESLFVVAYALYVAAKIGGDGVGDVSPAFFQIAVPAA